METIEHCCTLGEFRLCYLDHTIPVKMLRCNYRLSVLIHNGQIRRIFETYATIHSVCSDLRCESINIQVQVFKMEAPSTSGIKSK